MHEAEDAGFGWGRCPAVQDHEVCTEAMAVWQCAHDLDKLPSLLWGLQ